MPRMKQIKNAIRQHDAAAGLPQAFTPGYGIAQIPQFWIVEIHLDASLTIPPRM